MNDEKTLSPAKINLFLHIRGKRKDGYHDLFSLMCCISLYDTIHLNFHQKRTTITCSSKEIPEDESNLAFRAANLFFKASGIQEGVGIDIEKKIPVGAGLGGGSSNAASVLLSLNRFYDSLFTQDELMEMGLSLGADVPFFVFGKPAVATGIGEQLDHYNRLKPYHILIINPGYPVSTAEVYENLNLGLTKCEKNFNSNSFNEQGFDAGKHLCNDLETVTLKMQPDIKTIKKSLIRYGAEGALMTGSGPTVFSLFSDSRQAETAYRSLTQYSSENKFLADMII